MWFQKQIKLTAKRRGFHLVTQELVRQLEELKNFKIGLAHLFMQHTSASLAINENADPDVRTDLESFFNHIAPENEPYYKHVLEGSDDMPAHLKSVMIGASITIPITEGCLNLGVWQGIYLCEHRNSAGPRNIWVTLSGESY